MLFQTGNIYVSKGVNEKMQASLEFDEFVVKSLTRHITGDWGDLSKEDKAMNDSAVANNDDRIFSRYNYDEDTSIYIITEYDRSCTTVLFPEEY